jgi:aspartate kinase
MAGRAVIKFGGADLATGEKIRKAARMVLESGYREIVVVVSAMAGATDSLTKTISEVGSSDAKDYAEIVSMGERTSARIFCSALRSMGAQAEYFDPSQEGWPIITDSNFRDALPDMDKTCELVRRFVEPLLGTKIVVFCGFLGRDENGEEEATRLLWCLETALKLTRSCWLKKPKASCQRTPKSFKKQNR